ncbi:hypothetical protein CNMCM5793_004637 [Aspergillus hiratsukae]|uniref:CFEM domain-containing protein n=1 Tax=Aspergillus hiratsukae TaxID=1194566 RepID=A0A8H6P3J8_9EURO|nr:hypothetical protein CNMCM5793_004637 [Aspergillus hiratsukae]KAF7161307.1 hypothetical protein CNMCM6106_008596 [Aspergillus hiratsukae]
MKLYSVSLALAACLSMAAAQGLQDLPACARQCATNSIPANCGLSVECICSDSSFISGISCCILNTCPTDEQQEEAHPFVPTAAVQFANQICKTAGVTNLPQSPSCPSSTQSATGTSSATTSGSSTNTATNESNTTSQTSTASPTAATATTSTTGSTSTGAAVAQHKDIGLLAAAGAAAAAFGLLA